MSVHVLWQPPTSWLTYRNQVSENNPKRRQMISIDMHKGICIGEWKFTGERKWLSKSEILTFRRRTGSRLSKIRKSFTVLTLSMLNLLWNAPSFPIFSSRQTSSHRDGGWCFLYTARKLTSFVSDNSHTKRCLDPRDVIRLTMGLDFCVQSTSSSTSMSIQYNNYVHMNIENC